MKVAFHFNADHETFDYDYGGPIEERFFRILLENKAIEITTKIFLGDLLLHNLAMDREYTDTGYRDVFNRDKYLVVFQRWISSPNSTWCTFTEANIESFMNNSTYVVCLESVDRKTAQYLDEDLAAFSYYMGAVEVDDSSKVHRAIYSNSLVPRFRLERFAN